MPYHIVLSKTRVQDVPIVYVKKEDGYARATKLRAPRRIRYAPYKTYKPTTWPGLVRAINRGLKLVEQLDNMERIQRRNKRINRKAWKEKKILQKYADGGIGLSNRWHG
jgi:hypothetical protein